MTTPSSFQALTGTEAHLRVDKWGNAESVLLHPDTITQINNTASPIARGLKTTGAPVIVEAAAPPSAAQVLTALTPTTASWQTINTSLEFFGGSEWLVDGNTISPTFLNRSRSFLVSTAANVSLYLPTAAVLDAAFPDIQTGQAIAFTIRSIGGSTLFFYPNVVDGNVQVGWGNDSLGNPIYPAELGTNNMRWTAGNNHVGLFHLMKGGGLGIDWNLYLTLSASALYIATTFTP